MGAPEYAADKLSAVQAFSFGPRNCLGKNLAYSEMRLIAARFLWEFDVELLPESRDWIARQKVFNLWDKIPLMVKVHPR
jgi:aspirochlorine biosynthesis cytochrome P450 monooxygenase